MEVFCDGSSVGGVEPGSPPVTIPGKGANIDCSPLFQCCEELGRAMYIGPFRNAINFGGGNESYFDIAVGQAFVERWHEFKSGSTVKNNEKAGQLLQDVKRIFNFQSLDINPTPDKKTLQLLVNNRSFTLNELGGGISQFIVVLANAMIREPSYILIDEPELSLHPQLQLDFLTTLGSYASRGVLFCTHSIGLARAAAERIYTVRRHKEFESAVAEYNSLSQKSTLAEFLGELSFSAYSELGFDAILLVEGTTDVKAMQQFLRLLKKDHQVVLLPLGGSALINGQCEEQLVEIKRISTNVKILIDSERDSPDALLPKDRREFFDVCKKIAIPCHVLERRALENYFTERAIKDALGNAHAALGPYDKLKNVSNSWAKSDNWRLASRMTEPELEGTDFWPFLKSI
jgi:energy-coupling factor transporter ATP-binding protein EcfA2